MKRPPGLWILLSAGVLWLCVQNVNSVRATALIFGKTPTTSTTSTEGPDEEISATEASPAAETSNVTKPTLTGNPQIDWAWDPNLPQELNGKNLSDYPFYERVPEDIDFKCDGLHDGFYASVPHKCQVYHHCLFGTRYDFLCANYTAFDQKTFICHFVSEVDCVNSKKFWHRNDALYQAATTTTLKPLVIHTTAAEGLAATPLSLPSAPGARRPANGARRRPYRRRRPQYEYYDDEYYDEYYEERPRSRRKRPRPRPRPMYDDEYDEEYEEDRYERRTSRRPTHRRRTKDRRKPEYEEDEVDDRFEDEDFKNSRKNAEERKKSSQDSREDASNERKSEKRRPSSEEHQRKPFQPMHSSRKGSRKPASEEYEDEPVEDARPRKKEDRKPGGKPTEDGSRAIIKPVSGTIYDRPRLAPRIKLPVPKSEAEKYAYKPIHATVTQAPSAAADEEYYDDYEDEEPVAKSKPSRKPAEKSQEEEKETRKQVPAASRSRYTAKKPKEEERPRNRPSFKRENNRKRPVEYEDDYEEEERSSKHQHKTVEREEDVPKSRKERRPSGKPDKEASTTTTTTTTTTTAPTTTTTTTTTTTPAPYREKQDPIVRIVKRPFLPSRGGNPYSPRGLQPVGSKADKKQEPVADEEDYPVSEEMETKEGRRQYVKASTESKRTSEEQDVSSTERPFKASPALVKIPIRQKYVTTAVAQDAYKPTAQSEIRTSYKTKEYAGPRTTQKPKLPDNDPLDEYDVTLNDALNPTLPNLPVRSFPTGFSAAHDYTFSSFQRPRFVAVDPVLTQASTDYVYQAKAPVRQRYEIVPQNGYRGRTGPTAPQTQAYYSSF